MQVTIMAISMAQIIERTIVEVSDAFLSSMGCVDESAIKSDKICVKNVALAVTHLAGTVEFKPVCVSPDAMNMV